MGILCAEKMRIHTHTHAFARAQTQPAANNDIFLHACMLHASAAQPKEGQKKEQCARRISDQPLKKINISLVFGPKDLKFGGNAVGL